MAASPFRRWLRRLPHPAILRVDGRDVAVASGSNMWAMTEESVMALNPSKVEAIGEKGVLLRVHSFDREDDAPEDGEKAPANASELVLLARLIKEASDSGAQRHAEAYALAFDKLVGLVQILAARLGGLENAWQKAMQQTAQAQADVLLAQAQQTGEGGADGAIQAMLAQALFANGGMLPKAPANGATNGAAAKAKKGA